MVAGRQLLRCVNAIVRMYTNLCLNSVPTGSISRQRTIIWYNGVPHSHVSIEVSNLKANKYGAVKSCKYMTEVTSRSAGDCILVLLGLLKVRISLGRSV